MPDRSAATMGDCRSNGKFGRCRITATCTQQAGAAKLMQVWVLIPIAAAALRHFNPNMPNARAGSLMNDAAEWARRCHIEAARAIHPSTKAFLLELAAEYEAIAGEVVDLDPDDMDLQNAVADRLSSLAAKVRGTAPLSPKPL